MLQRIIVSTLVVSLSFLAGCSETSTPQPDPNQTEKGAGHLQAERIELFEAEPALQRARVVLERDEPFEQVGFHYTTDSSVTPIYRVRHTNGHWSDWQALKVTWSEARFRVARILLEEQAEALELNHTAGVDTGKVEFFTERVAHPNILTRDLPLEGVPEASAAGEAMAAQQVAPRSLVIPRSAWGARDPDRVCGSGHDPYRMSIHHTYLPADDGGDPAAAMRSIQAYHIDSNGWCDIGYHFVVSQSGNIYQGRSSEERTGAHVGGQNTGNIGICLIGDFTSQTPADQQLNPTAEIVGWVSDTYGIPLDRNSVKGHQEWPGQSTSCPGGNLLSRIDTILQRAESGTDPEPPDPLEVSVSFLELDNFYQQGESSEFPDALPGDTFKAEVWLSNTTDGTIRGVYLGYLIENPYLRATDYTIYSDHPEHDQSSWTVNSANDEEENPAGDQLGEQGKLNMHAFAAGETKRVVLDMEAARYSFGQVHHPDVRAWLHSVEDQNGTKLYGDQTGWDTQPGTNVFGDWIRDYAHMDVLAEDRWSFDDQWDEASFEGWTQRGDVSEMSANTEDGLVTFGVSGGDPGIVSPSWTRIDAESFDHLVMGARSHDGTHVKEIYWAGEGEQFSEDRAVRFEAAGNSELETLVIPVGDHPAWSGEVTKLRVDLYDGDPPPESANKWYGVDYIFFQSSDSEMTTNGGDYETATPVDLLDSGDHPDDPDDPDADTGGDPDVGTPDAGGDGSDNDQQSDSGATVQVREGGCSTATSRPFSHAMALLLVVLAGAWTRRRER